ncbi:MFS transporter [Halobacteriales archaeon Cl-PHB]
MGSRPRSVASALRGGGRGWVLAAVAVGWLFILGGRFLVPALLPQIKDAFDLGNTGGGVAVTLIWMTYGLTQSPAGVLTDRLGERRLLAGSLALSAASVVVLGVAPVFLAFLVGCAAFGFATGLYGPARGTVLSRTFMGSDNAAIGITLAAGSVGSAVLPFLAGGLVSSLGWRWVVGTLVAPLAVAAGFAWWAIPAHDPGQQDRESSAATQVRDVGGAIRSRGVVLATVGSTLMVWGFQALSAFYVTYLVEIREFDQQVAAGMLSLVFVGGAVAQVGGGVVADRFGSRGVLIATSAVGALSVGAIPFVHGQVGLAALSLVIGIRLAIAPVANAYIIATLPDAVTGSAWGTLRTLFFIVGATGSTFVGVMGDAALFDEAFLVLAGVTGVAALLYALLPTRAEA